MVIAERHINGLTLNPLEYLLEEDGNKMLFTSEYAAKQFLRNSGFADEDMYYLTFEIVGTTPEGVESVNG